jgi:hypothetical protein
MQMATAQLYSRIAAEDQRNMLQIKSMPAYQQKRVAENGHLAWKMY